MSVSFRRAVVGLALVVTMVVACAPAGSQKRNLQGLRGAVVITRDSNGVPHIRTTKDDLDAFYAQGYVHAQDRLWQLELNRRTGAGRLSEILGAAALEQDKFLRTWGFYRAAQTAWPALSARGKAVLEAYSAGVNARIAEGNWPLEFTLLGAKPEPWTPIDSLVWAKMFAFDLGSNWDDEIENAAWVKKIGVDGINELFPGPPKGSATILRLGDYKGKLEVAPVAAPAMNDAVLARLSKLRGIVEALPTMGAGDATGSNNWVVGPSRSATGKPILANDPHLALRAPSLWYFLDLEGPGLSVVGASIPGLPGVVIGHNKRISWGVTNNAPDTQDLFVLDVKNNQYTTGAGLRSLESRQEVIRVGAKETTITVRTSEFGPVISDVGATGTEAMGIPADPKNPQADGQAVALSWVALQPGDTSLDAFIGLNYAQNWAEFNAALRDFVTPTQNFVYADVDGNIGYVAPGRIPKRDWDGRFPVDAATGKTWSGYMAFDDLPRVYNPQEGFIVTANNRVLPHGAGQDISTYREHYRAQRIRERILETAKHTPDTMREIQGDTLSIPARDILPFVLALTPKTEAAKELQDVLRSWDLRAGLDSVGATAFAFYYRELTRIVEDELEIKYFNEPLFLTNALRNGSRFCDNTKTNVIEDCATWNRLALEAAGAAITKQLGANSSAWRWGDLHTLEVRATIGSAPIVGPMLNRRIATPGSILTVNVARYNQDSFVQTSGPSLRVVFDMAALDNSRFVYPGGQSGDFLNPLYDNLLKPWRDNQNVVLSQNPSDWGKTQNLGLQP